MKNATIEKSSYSRSITQLMRDATNPDPVVLLRSIQNENIVATLFQKDEKGRTALDWARLTRNYQAITVLLNLMSTQINNARVNSINTFDKLENLLRLTNEAQGIQLQEAIKLRNVSLALKILLENKLVREEVEALGEVFFADWVGKVGYSPLILAAGMNMKDVVRELVNLRAPLDHANRYGHTALTIAANAGNADVVYFLLHNGANVYHKTLEHRTALHYACQYAKAKVVKVIFDHVLERFAVFRNDSHSLTEFDYTRWTTYANMVDSLLIARDNDGKTALELLPTKLDDMYRIERRLKLSGGTGLKPLDQRRKDARSLDMNTSYVDMDINSDFNDEEEDKVDQMSVGTPIRHDENHVQQDEMSEMSSIQSSSKFSFPEWSHNTDDQQVIEFHNIEDVFSLKTSMPLENEVAYIKQQFEKVKDRVIQWLVNADKEQALVQLIPCPLNCGTSCKVEDLSNHVRDECLLRILQCSLCHQIIQYRNVKDHDLNHCVKRTITCEQCFHQFPAETLERHLKLSCKRRIVRCRQLCDLAMPYDERDVHEQLHCKNRKIKCDQCHQEMLADEYAQHLLNSCPERMIRCSIGCGESFKAKDIQDHEENICQRHCRWDGCSRKIGPPAILSYHEQYECPEKPALCCYSCGIPDLKIAWKLEHEETCCPCRPIFCENGCSEVLSANSLDQHVDLFNGDCTERAVICPFDLIGWKILLEDENLLEGLILKYERRFTHPIDDRFSIDEVYIKTPKGSKWYNVWKTKFTLLSKQSSSASLSSFVPSSSQPPLLSQPFTSISQYLSCSWVIRSNLRRHLEQECPNRAVYVKGNFQSASESTLAITNGSTEIYSFPGQRTDLQSAFEVSQNHALADDYYQYLQNPDDRACKHCGKILLKSKYQEHLEDECELVDLFCPIGCGQRIKRQEIAFHTTNVCKKRYVNCSLCFRNDLWAEELEDHQANDCSHRVLVCSLLCNIPNIKACEMVKHQRDECPRRPIQCECGLSFESKDLDEHKRLNCVYRLVGCPQGCGQSMSLYLVENHIEYFCTNRNHIYDRVEECPNGCGLSMMKKELLHHVTYECRKRLIECSNHCGNTFPYDSLPSHLIVCPNRMVCCEPNLTMCAKPLHEWLYKEVTISQDDNTFDQSLVEENENNSPNSVRSESQVTMSPNRQFVANTVVSSLAMGTFQPNDALSMQLPTAKNDTTLPNTKTDTLFTGQNLQIQVTSIGGIGRSSNFFHNLKVIKVHNSSINIAGSAGITATNRNASSASYTSEKQTHTTADNSTSSVFIEDHAMKFRDDLRMCFCDKHHTSVVMAAIRYNQISFMEYILKQLKQTSDIDSENIYGDTALTIACRLGRLDLTELLVQHGADVNKETSNGRTALIEAVKSEEEHVALIEYLIKEGCIVAYKTRRHRRSALDWARRYGISEAAALIEKHFQTTGEKLVLTHEKKRLLGRPRTVRILELAAVVQKQSNLLFQQIALGNNEIVIKTIENGDFFDPNMEEKCYKQMEQFVEQSEQCDHELNEIQLKLGKNHDKIDTLSEKQDSLKLQLNELEKTLQKCYKNEKKWDSKINYEFIIYEKSMSNIFSEDLEEISRFQYPSKILVSSLFISGILFDLFPQNSYVDVGKYPLLYHYNNQTDPLEPFHLTNDRIFSEKGSWWNQLLLKMFLMKSQDIIRKMQSYTRAKLHIERSKKLFQQAKLWLQLLLDCAKQEVIGEDIPASSSLVQLNNVNTFIASGSEPLTLRISTTASSTRPTTASYPDENIADPLNLDIPYDDFVNPQKKKKAELLRQSSNLTNGSPMSTRPSSPMKSAPSSRASSPNRSQHGSPTRRKLTAEEKYIKELEKEYGLDSDEEKALQGEWVKGEWVPGKPKKKKDGKLSKLKTQLLNTITTSNTTGLEEKNTDEDNLEETNQRLLFITEHLLQESKRMTLEELKKTSRFSTQAGNSLEVFDALGVLNENLALNADSMEEGDVMGLNQSSIYEDDDSLTSPSRRLTRGKSTRSMALSRTSSTNSLLSNDSSTARGSVSSPMTSPKGSPNRRKKSRRRSSLLTRDREDENDGPASPSRKRGKDRRNRRKSTAFQSEEDRLLASNPLSVYSPENLVGYSFIQSIIYLLKAIMKYSTYYSQILQQKALIFSSVNKMETLKLDNTETTEEYEKQIAIRQKQEKEYIKLLKRSKFLQEKLTTFRDRVRIARLMNFVSVNGHTLISWTAVYGNFEVMEVMLSRGGTVGFNASLLHLTATYLQLTYKIYRVACKKYDKDGTLPGSTHLAVDGAVGLLKKAENIKIIQELTVLKEQRAKLLAKIHYQKFKLRFPIPEAIYAGKWEIIQRIYERRLWHCQFMNTWTFPSPPPPFKRDVIHQYDHSKLTPLDILSHAMNNLASGAYVAGKGWVPPNHPEEPYGELSSVLQKILEELKEKRNAYIANRIRIRALSNERKNQKSGEEEMAKAIYRRDYRHCIYLAERRGITIDLETPDGSTALIGASEEDADALNHEYMINDDGSKCLAVEYLLDRHYYRPAINLETTAGYTALIRACVMGRSHVIVALLDRGANINHINRFGKAAIHYAASLGHSEVTRILVERFADLSLKDNHGRTAYEIAEQENYVNLMTLLSQFRCGNLGPLQLTRGRVNNQITCPNGCGKILYLAEKKGHLEICQYRIVPCPNNCSRHDLQYRELSDHIKTDCENRLIACEKCRTEFPLGYQSTHDTEDCIYRIIECPYKCGKKDLLFCDLNQHLSLRCTHRKIPCTLRCGLSIREVDMDDHQSRECDMRRITCPNKCHHQIIAMQLNMHLVEQCPCRYVLCTQCGDERIMAKDLDYHRKELCSMRLVPCPERCTELIPHANIEIHLRESCQLKFISCPNLCPLVIQRKFLQRHLEKECELRLVPCPNGCLDHEKSSFLNDMIQCYPMNILKIHAKKECPDRFICCSLCQLSIKSKYLSLHQEKDCLKRLVKCKNEGCKKEISFEDLSNHMNHSCRFRMIECPQGCGSKLAFLHSKHHMQKDCVMRFLTCTLQCGERMRFYELADHLAYACVRRFKLEEAEKKNDPYAIVRTKKLNKKLQGKKDESMLEKSKSGPNLSMTGREEEKEKGIDEDDEDEEKIRLLQIELSKTGKTFNYMKILAKENEEK